jgi:hypothetical protein
MAQKTEVHIETSLAAFGGVEENLICHSFSISGKSTDNCKLAV